jgi:hypothetical protein
MLETLKEFADLGSTVLITLAFLFVFYEIQKQKKQGPQVFNGKSVDILNELKLMNANHLHSIEEAIRDGNDKLVKEINGGNMKTVEMLSEICARLTNVK